MNYFFEAIFKDNCPVSNNYLSYLLDKLLANDRNLYPLTYFLVLDSIEYFRIHKFEEFLFFNKQFQINFIFYF